MNTNIPSRQIAVGVFETREKAEAAIAELEGAGFSSSDIGIAARDDRGEWSEFRTPDETTAAEKGAMAGAATGAGVGGLWALGIAAGMLPAIGPVIAGGLTASILASAATGAAAGGMVGSLVGLGFSEEDAHAYETEFANGRVIVTVRARDRYVQASRILLSHGAIDVATRTAATV